MKDCQIIALYSGSGGNSVYIRVAHTAILIDAGKSARALCRSLQEIGADIGNIDAIFVTHDHHDHTSALEILAKHHTVPIHMTDASAAVFDRYPDSAVHKRLVRHDPNFSVTVGELAVRSFRTPHDSRMSVGYRVSFEDEGKTRAFGVATDIGHVTDELREGLWGCEAVVLEANHDVNMLMEGPYPYELKKRIRSPKGHLSNHDSALFAAELAAGGTKAFLLAHLSEENNDPSLAWDEVASAIADPRVTIRTAAPHMPTELPIPCKEEPYCAGC